MDRESAMAFANLKDALKISRDTLALATEHVAFLEGVIADAPPPLRRGRRGRRS
jgi:hypothetical protein